MKTDVGFLSLVLTILMGAAGGAAVGLQGPLASVMSQKVGPVESSFFIRLGGSIYGHGARFDPGYGQLGLADAPAESHVNISSG